MLIILFLLLKLRICSYKIDTNYLKTITQQSKAFENPNIVEISSVTTDIQKLHRNCQIP